MSEIEYIQLAEIIRQRFFRATFVLKIISGLIVVVIAVFGIITIDGHITKNEFFLISFFGMISEFILMAFINVDRQIRNTQLKKLKDSWGMLELGPNNCKIADIKELQSLLP